ncbi:hypothetical protein EOM86_02150 [Candidatus Nomurabacteria bacterium]|nr:hypothetical protein [Candidatus Nomurabacteria bacterium]
METIAKLFESINKLDRREVDSSFLEMIVRDCEAFSKQLNPLIVTTSEADHLKFKGLFSPDWVVQPLSSFSELSDSHFRLVDRCKLLITFTKATQLIPFKLSQLMHYSDINGIPVLVVITGTDRVASVDDINIPGQLGSVMPKNNFSWLDANEYEGMDILKQSIMHFVGRVDQNRRSRDLTSSRKAQLKPLLNISLDRLVKYQKKMHEFIQITDGFRKKDILLERSKLESIENSFRQITDNVKQIDPEGIVGSLADRNPQQMLNESLEQTKQALIKALGDHSEDIVVVCAGTCKTINEQNQHRLKRMADEAQDKFDFRIEIPPTLDRLDFVKIYDAFIKSVEDIISEDITVPIYLIWMAKYKDVTDYLPSKKKNKDLNSRTGADDNPDKETQKKENDESEDSHIKDELAKIFNVLPSQLLQSRLPEVIRVSLDDIIDRIDRQIKSAMMKMSDELEEFIVRNYAQISRDIMKEKHAIETRIHKLTRVLDEIK